MEISNEIKFKVALQYYGQPFLVCYNIENKPVIETFSGKNIEEGMYEPDVVNKRELLILKPLSKITQDDAIEFHDIVFGGIGKKPYHVVAETVRNYIEMIFKGGKQCPDIKGLVLTTQFLQSKGYDLPSYLLEGKTLQEVGLAIYEGNI